MLYTTRCTHDGVCFILHVLYKVVLYNVYSVYRTLPSAHFSHFLCVLFSIVNTSLGEERGKRELVHLFLVHLFVYLACVTFCLLSLPLVVRQFACFNKIFRGRSVDQD